MSEPPYGLDEPPPGPEPQAMKGRVMPPAIFLLIVNVLNLLIGLYFLFEAYLFKSGNPFAQAYMEQQWKDMDPDQRDELKKQGWTPAGFVEVAGNITLAGGALGLLVGVIGLFGAVRMMSLRSYGLAITASILTAIPCVSPCCLLGQIAGIWALIVLLNADVRSAFR